MAAIEILVGICDYSIQNTSADYSIASQQHPSDAVISGHSKLPRIDPQRFKIKIVGTAGQGKSTFMSSLYQVGLRGIYSSTLQSGIVHFSGHGVEYKSLSNKVCLSNYFIYTDQLAVVIQHKAVIILDACHSGALMEVNGSVLYEDYSISTNYTLEGLNASVCTSPKERDIDAFLLVEDRDKSGFKKTGKISSLINFEEYKTRLLEAQLTLDFIGKVIKKIQPIEEFIIREISAKCAEYQNTTFEREKNTSSEKHQSSSVLKFFLDRYGLKKVLDSVETGKIDCDSLMSRTLMYEQLLIEYYELAARLELSEDDMLRIDEILEIAENDDMLAFLIQEAEYHITQNQNFSKDNDLKEKKQQDNIKVAFESELFSGNFETLKIDIQENTIIPADITGFMAQKPFAINTLEIKPDKEEIQDVMKPYLKRLLIEYYELATRLELSEDDMLRIDEILEIAENDDMLAFLIQEAEYFIAQKSDYSNISDSDRDEILRIRLKRLAECNTNDSSREEYELLLEKFNSEFQLLWNQNDPEPESLYHIVDCKLRELQLDTIFDVEPLLIDSYVHGVSYIKDGGNIKNTREWIKDTTLTIIENFLQKRSGSVNNQSIGKMEPDFNF